ncbi:MAG: hypothetical protein N2234_08940, partial [Planctomycetota bacterium]|nr:hypothetical protein [Planctomycetota bacterium]
ARRNEYANALKKAEEKFKEVEQLDAEKKGGFADRIEFYRLVGKMSEKGDIRSNSDAAKEIASECSSFAEKFGESEFAPTTLFWAGYSYFFAKEYKKSLEKLEKLLKDYGDTSVAYQAKRFKEQVENKLKEEEKKEEEKKEEEKKEGGG